MFHLHTHCCSLHMPWLEIEPITLVYKYQFGNQLSYLAIAYQIRIFMNGVQSCDYQVLPLIHWNLKTTGLEPDIDPGWYWYWYWSCLHLKSYLSHRQRTPRRSYQHSEVNCKELPWRRFWWFDGKECVKWRWVTKIRGRSETYREQDWKPSWWRHWENWNGRQNSCGPALQHQETAGIKWVAQAKGLVTCSSSTIFTPIVFIFLITCGEQTIHISRIFFAWLSHLILQNAMIYFCPCCNIPNHFTMMHIFLSKFF